MDKNTKYTSQFTIQDIKDLYNMFIKPSFLGPDAEDLCSIREQHSSLYGCNFTVIVYYTNTGFQETNSIALWITDFKYPEEFGASNKTDELKAKEYYQFMAKRFGMSYVKDLMTFLTGIDTNLLTELAVQHKKQKRLNKLFGGYKKHDES